MRKRTFQESVRFIVANYKCPTCGAFLDAKRSRTLSETRQEWGCRNGHTWIADREEARVEYNPMLRFDREEVI